MHNFVLHLPTKILFGEETIPSVGKEAARFGRKALLVYGSGSIKKNGVYQQIVSSLSDSGIEILEHGGIRSNPLLSMVREGIHKARTGKVELVIAAGGGSVIDSAKAIAAGCLVEHDVWQFFRGKKSIAAKLPLICVLTIAAAGSEMNGGMVLTHDEKRQKFGTGSNHLRPEVSILDPNATMSVPADYTAYGAVDAIAHILEFYLTTQEAETAVQDRLMEGLIINLMASCERVLLDPKSYAGRADLMWCSTLALNGLTAAGLGRVSFPMHMIEHSLSALYDVPHGAGLSVVMPAWMTWQTNKNPARTACFARRVFGINQAEDRQAAREGIKQLKNWFVKVKSPVSLEELDISASAIPALSENSLALAKVWRLADYDRERITAILEMMTITSDNAA